MIIECPSCKTRFSVDEAQISHLPNPRFHCSRCDNLFTKDESPSISPRSNSKKTESAAPAPLTRKATQLSFLPPEDEAKIVRSAAEAEEEEIQTAEEEIEESEEDTETEYEAEEEELEEESEDEEAEEDELEEETDDEQPQAVQQELFGDEYQDVDFFTDDFHTESEESHTAEPTTESANKPFKRLEIDLDDPSLAVDWPEDSDLEPYEADFGDKHSSINPLDRTVTAASLETEEIDSSDAEEQEAEPPLLEITRAKEKEIHSSQRGEETRLSKYQAQRKLRSRSSSDNLQIKQDFLALTAVDLPETTLAPKVKQEDVNFKSLDLKRSLNTFVGETQAPLSYFNEQSLHTSKLQPTDSRNEKTKELSSPLGLLNGLKYFPRLDTNYTLLASSMLLPVLLAGGIYYWSQHLESTPNSLQGLLGLNAVASEQIPPSGLEVMETSGSFVQLKDGKKALLIKGAVLNASQGSFSSVNLLSRAFNSSNQELARVVTPLNSSLEIKDIESLDEADVLNQRKKTLKLETYLSRSGISRKNIGPNDKLTFLSLITDADLIKTIEGQAWEADWSGSENATEQKTEKKILDGKNPNRASSRMDLLKWFSVRVYSVSK